MEDFIKWGKFLDEEKTCREIKNQGKKWCQAMSKLQKHLRKYLIFIYTLREIRGER